MPRLHKQHFDRVGMENQEAGCEHTETNALTLDEEYGTVHPGSTVPRSMKPVLQDDASESSNCGWYCLIAFAVFVMCIIMGSLWLVFEDLGYEDVYTYFIVPAAATAVAGSGSGVMESCRDKIWWGRVCDFFPPAASAVHGPRRTIGCEGVNISPEPCDELQWEIATNHFISCDSFNLLEKSSYDFCEGGWPGGGGGSIGSYTAHGHG
tara:strand:- start:1307 stop:1930 length:624 start_codon:yes stop_codon:yes gene_type:complete